MSKTNDSYCVMPFVALQTRPSGEVRPCGRYLQPLADRADRLQEIFYGSEMEKIREEMSEGRKLPGCERCYEVERSGARSFRNFCNQRFGHRESARQEFLEISFSNLCNLSCRSCSSEFSSRWNADDARLGRKAHGVLNSTVGQISVESLRTLKLLGGEPLLHEAQIIQLLQKVEQRGEIGALTVEISTNGTIRPAEKLLQWFGKCREIRLQLSLDGTGELSDYLRSGSRWDELRANVHYFVRELKYPAFVNTVVTALNLNLLDGLAQWLSTEFPNLYQNHDPAYRPAELAIQNLPDRVKVILKKRFSTLFSPDQKGAESIHRILGALDRPRTCAPQRVAEWIRAVDAIRGERFETVNPEMHEWLFGGEPHG